MARKIKAAREALAQNRLFFLEQAVIAADALEIGCLVEEIPAILGEILADLNPSDYAGGTPPDRSYKDKIFGCDLFAFTSYCVSLGCDIYLKFSLKDDYLWLVSFHKDRKEDD